jgi:AAHS family 3-hydroxyphenylpropionic acid transporter
MRQLLQLAYISVPNKNNERCYKMKEYTAQATELSVGSSAHAWITISLCFIVAMLEGLDLQAAGIAAAGLKAQFDLSSSALGAVFSAGIFGLLPGALFGGWMADRTGRKGVLIGAVLLFGLFSISTAYAWDLNSLLAFRFLTGVGLGAAMPNLIALPAEAVGSRLRSTAVSFMYCGVPLGAAFAALLSMAGMLSDWKVIFYLGGIAPLLVVPLLAFFLPESSAFKEQQHIQSHDAIRPSILQGLFGPGTKAATVLLWVAYFFTLLVMYMLINWLPTLLIGQGFSSAQASRVLFSMQIGGALGSVALGLMMDRSNPLILFILTYSGILASLVGLAISVEFQHLLVAGFVAGFFVLGAQLMLYALAPSVYPTRIRATGVGSAVAIGRLGAMSGPLVAGQMLSMGFGAAGVICGAMPGIVLSAAAVSLLISRSRKNQVSLK